MSGAGRPSWDLPGELFDALVELEELAHVVGRTPPESGLAHVQAVVNAGGARDRLATLILARIG